MKVLHLLPVVFAYLLTLTVGIVGCSELATGIERIAAGGNTWTGASSIVSGMLSLGLAYCLWRSAGSVRANARLTCK